MQSCVWSFYCDIRCWFGKKSSKSLFLWLRISNSMGCGAEPTGPAGGGLAAACPQDACGRTCPAVWSCVVFEPVRHTLWASCFSSVSMQVYKIAYLSKYWGLIYILRRINVRIVSVDNSEYKESPPLGRPGSIFKISKLIKSTGEKRGPRKSGVRKKQLANELLNTFYILFITICSKCFDVHH